MAMSDSLLQAWEEMGDYMTTGYASDLDPELAGRVQTLRNSMHAMAQELAAPNPEMFDDHTSEPYTQTFLVVTRHHKFTPKG